MKQAATRATRAKRSKSSKSSDGTTKKADKRAKKARPKPAQSGALARWGGGTAVLPRDRDADGDDGGDGDRGHPEVPVASRAHGLHGAGAVRAFER